MTMRTVLDALETLEGYAAMAAYTLVAALLIGDVLARELIGAPIMGSLSIAVLGAIVAGFLGLSLATAADAHLRPTVADNLVPAGLERLVERGSDLLAALFYLGIAIFAVRFVMESHAAGDRAAVLYFPLWPIQIVMPYAFLSCAVRHAAYAVDPGLRTNRPAIG